MFKSHGKKHFCKPFNGIVSKENEWVESYEILDI